MAEIGFLKSVFLVLTSVLIALPPSTPTPTCECEQSTSHPSSYPTSFPPSYKPSYPPISSPGCEVKMPIVPVSIKELVGPSCSRISYPQVVVNAKVATFNDKATCIKYCLSTSDDGPNQGKFVQSSRLVCNGAYKEEECDVTQLSPGVLEFNCKDIDTVYYEHIHYFDGPVLISTTCLYVKETFVDQMIVYMSTDRIWPENVIKDKFCELGIKVNSVEILKQPYCEN